VPLIRVAQNDGTTILSEGRFAADPTTIAKAAPQTWKLPITVRSLASSQMQTKIIDGPTDFVLLPPVLVNAGQTTYGRVLYSHDGVGALVSHMASLSSADQLGLLNDTVSLGLAGYTGANDVLAMVNALPVAADPIVWQRTIAILQTIDAHYTQGPAKTAYRRFVVTLLHPLADRLGYSARPAEDGNVEILRASLERALGKFGDRAVADWAKRTLATQQASAADLRTAVDVIASQADAQTFDRLLAQATGEKDPLDKQHAFEALAGVQDPALVRRMVEIAFGDGPPPGTAPDLVSSLASTDPDIVWSLALPHLQDPKVPLANAERWGLAVGIASRSALPEREVALKAYEARNVPESSRRPFAGALASIQQNRHIAHSAMPQITRWVSAQLR
jgi:aminopeptidase N